MTDRDAAYLPGKNYLVLGGATPDYYSIEYTDREPDGDKVFATFGEAKAELAARRYGWPSDGNGHTPDATACVNTLPGVIERLEAQIAPTASEPPEVGHLRGTTPTGLTRDLRPIQGHGGAPEASPVVPAWTDGTKWEPLADMLAIERAALLDPEDDALDTDDDCETRR